MELPQARTLTLRLGGFRRVIEAKLIAVGIVDHEEPIAPRAVLHRNAVGFESCTERVECGDLSIWLGVEGDEDEALADLLGPVAGEEDRLVKPRRST
jgi:hypothetical protein